VEESFIPETKLWNKVSGSFTTELLTRVCINKTPKLYAQGNNKQIPKSRMPKKCALAFSLYFFL
jgi:hypothetical protein